jgi:hypothetical protein
MAQNAPTNVLMVVFAAMVWLKTTTEYVCRYQNARAMLMVKNMRTVFKKFKQLEKTTSSGENRRTFLKLENTPIVKN